MAEETELQKAAARVTKAVGEKQGGVLVTVRAADVLALCESIPEGKRTKQTRDYALGASNAIGVGTTWPNPEAIVQQQANRLRAVLSLSVPTE